MHASTNISFPPYQLVPVEKDVCGLRLNLPVGDNDNIYGLDLGLLGVASESNKGIMLNLIGNVCPTLFSTADNGGFGTKGIQVGGLFNLSFGPVQGIQIAGFTNFGNMQGMQIAGLWNGGGEVRGIQVAPIINLALITMQGIQVAAANYSEKASGLQCGFYNHTKSVRGIQIGLINLTQELSGLQIGLVNYIRESPVPILPIINLKF